MMLGISSARRSAVWKCSSALAQFPPAPVGVITPIPDLSKALGPPIIRNLILGCPSIVDSPQPQRSARPTRFAARHTNISVGLLSMTPGNGQVHQSVLESDSIEDRTPR